ncbi:hypothetical protein LTR17_010281 [Elasticomyces elasticus]|nr:hypothetical protein LTR17_010281 [Elasticomyces elasticus]
MAVGSPSDRPWKEHLDELRDDLHHLSIQNYEGKKFIPKTTFSEHVTREVVDRCLTPETKVLLQTTCESARATFATLALSAKSRRFHLTLQEFIALGLTDINLPVEIRQEGGVYFARTIVAGDPNKVAKQFGPILRDWTKKEVEDFSDQQWRFLAPVFNPDSDRFVRYLDRRQPLPFTEVGNLSGDGHFADVRKAFLHREHQKGFTWWRDAENNSQLPIAVKEYKITAGTDVAKRAWEVEARVCEQMPRHKHIVERIAAIAQDDRYYLLLAWADGGNLKSFWQSNPGPAVTGKQIMEILEQFLGLALATLDMHTNKETTKAIEIVEAAGAHSMPTMSTSKVTLGAGEPAPAASSHWRHGDLKSDDILRFTNDESWLGTLKIADLGLAKPNTVNTKHRQEETSTEYTTTQYEAPEARTHPSAPRSRLYDIWSIGCILLETVIWSLYGFEQLDHFWTTDITTSKATLFYTTTGSATGLVAEVSEVASSWMKRILEQDPECNGPEGSALGDLLRLVQQKLLVVATPDGPGHDLPDRRIDAAALCDSLRDIISKAAANPKYLSTGTDRSNISTPGKLTHPRQSASSSSGDRLAPEMANKRPRLDVPRHDGQETKGIWFQVARHQEETYPFVAPTPQQDKQKTLDQQSKDSEQHEGEPPGANNSSLDPAYLPVSANTTLTQETGMLSLSPQGMTLDSVRKVYQLYQQLKEIGDPGKHLRSQGLFEIEDEYLDSQVVPRTPNRLDTHMPWQWLKNRITQGYSESQWPYTIMDTILASYALSQGTRLGDHGQYQLEVFVQWNPETYLCEHFENVNDDTLGQSIVLSGQRDDLEACTCEEYLTQNWSVVGSALLDILQQALHDGLSESATYQMLQGSTVSFRLEDNHLVVLMCAQIHVLVELAEQLAWLGASCAVSPYANKPCLRQTRLAEMAERSTSNHQFLKIEYETSEVNGLADCWKSLVRNPSIAQDFPAKARHPGFNGMEMSLDTMITLGDLWWATVYDNKFMLKGLSSAFYPIAIKAKSVLWHFVCTQNGEHLPYAAAADSCAGAEVFVGMDVSWLRSSRHFVGWTPQAALMLGKFFRHIMKVVAKLTQYVIGTKDYNYALLGYPNNLRTGSNLKLERFILGGGQWLTVGGSITKGDHHRALFMSEIPDYVRMVHQARDQYMTLYDTAEKLAYLTDGASALLHLTSLQLTRPDSRWTHNSEVSRTFVYADPAGEDPSVTALLDEDNLAIALRRVKVKTTIKVTHNESGVQEERTESEYRSYEVRDLVRDNYLVLSKLWARSSEDTAGMDLRLTTRPRLEGWSLLDVVLEKLVLKPATVYLEESGNGWPHLVRAIKAPILMGTRIGEPIVATTSSCTKWSTVPPGMDYLACMLSLLERIAREHGQVGVYPGKLLSDLVWHGGDSLFEPCDGRTKHGSTSCCDRIQSLYSSRLAHCSRPEFPVQHSVQQSHGAVIFGRSARYDSTTSNVLGRSWARLTSTMGLQRNTQKYDSTLQGPMLVSRNAHSPRAYRADNSLADALVVSRSCPDIRVWAADSERVPHENLNADLGIDDDNSRDEPSPSSGSRISTTATGSSPPIASSHTVRSSASSQTSNMQRLDPCHDPGSDVMQRWVRWQSSITTPDGEYGDSD